MQKSVKENKKKTVLVAMSGGVDSSVAAYLLKQQGYNLIGINMKFWTEDSAISSGHLSVKDNKCCSIEGVEDARSVCDALGIPFYVLNLKDDFKQDIVEYFISSFKLGLTPNPCVMCNKKIKFGLLYEKLKEFNADFVATGHYARIINKGGKYFLSRSVDLSKDQSYFLHNISPLVLSQTLFPIGELASKDYVRSIAKNAHLRISSKQDSQEICFIPGNDYKGFIQRNVPISSSKGNIVDKEGNILGQHDGLSFYTIAQRRGINTKLTKPLYVIKKNYKDNTLVVGDIEDCKTYNFKINNLNLLTESFNIENVKIQIRYRGKLLELENIKYSRDNPDTLIIKLKEGEVGVASGQFGVLYDGNYVVGGGVINTKIN